MESVRFGWLRWMLLPLAASACTSTEITVCSTGLVCPADRVCSAAGNRCLDPNSLYVPDTELSFPGLRCGSTAQRSLTVSNPSTEELAFTVQSTLSLVSVSPSSATLGPGEEVEVLVLVDGASEELPIGSLEGALLFMVGEEVIPRLIEVDLEGAIVSTSASQLDFGVASLTALPGPRTLTIFNEGNAAIDVQVGAATAPFSAAGEPILVEGGGSEDIEIAFDPEFTGTYGGNVGLSFSGPLCQSAPLSVDLSGIIDDAPVLISTTILDFGSTHGCGGGGKSQSLTLTSNLGDDQMVSFAITGTHAEAFSAPTTQMLSAGGTLEVSVERLSIPVPTIPGPRSASLQITASPSGETLQVAISHQIIGSYLTTTVDKIDFGMMEAQSSKTENVLVINSGNAPAVAYVMPESFPLPDNGKIDTSPLSAEVGANGGALQFGLQASVNKAAFEEMELRWVATSEGNCSPPIDRSLTIACCDDVVPDPDPK